MKVTIVGSGDLAKGLGNVFYRHGQPGGDSIWELMATEPIPDQGIGPGDFLLDDESIPMIGLEEALAESDMLLLAIPAWALKGFLREHISKIGANAILVDCTNSKKRGEDVAGALKEMELDGVSPFWVKAFNDTGAISLLQMKASSKKKFATDVCGSERWAVDAVVKFAEAHGFTTTVVPLEHFAAIAVHQSSFGPEWVHSGLMLVIIFFLTWIYAICRYNNAKGYPWSRLPLQVTNKAICWTAIYGFALAQLPGVLARIQKQMFGFKKKIPRGVLWALNLRKQLGILSLWFLVCHIIMSLIIMSPAYYGKFFEDDGHMNWKGESCLLFGTLGAAFYFILGVCSLPSVGDHMTSMQYQLIFGILAWVALVCGTVHVLIMGVEGWTKQETWPANMPPITILSVVIPFLVMALKLVQMSMWIFIKLAKVISTAKKNEQQTVHPDNSPASV